MRKLPDYCVDLSPERDALVLVDQTLLPGQVVLRTLRTQPEIWHAIHSLMVRGAPAIGVAAGMAAYLAARNLPDEGFPEAFEAACAFLATSRPTAVNLFWALDRMRACAARHDIQTVREALYRECVAIRDEDEAMCEAIGEHGLTLLQPGMGILTHCNAGMLAAMRYGTALAPVYLGQQRGYAFKVYADETRPLLQGARLTALELMRAGVDVTLLCDNAAATVMRQGLVQAVIVGADRIARNGDVVNKVGTSAVAILARHFGIPFYVCAPSSTWDDSCPTGLEIPIEQRAGEEITRGYFAKPIAPEGVKTFNPAFDVTDHALVSAIITENGILRVNG